MRTYTEEQKNRKREYQREYKRKNREKIRKLNNEWTDRNRERHYEMNRLNMRKSRGGIPESTTRPMPTVCEACGLSSKNMRWDHDHVTGLFRGWICHRCNLMLGFIEKCGGFDGPTFASLKNYYTSTMANVANLLVT